MHAPTTYAFIFCLLLSAAGKAQQATESAPASEAVQAYARGNDSYLMFPNEGYKADKQYKVIKFWNVQSPPGEEEKAELARLKEQLLKKNVQLVDFSWENADELNAVLNKHQFTASVSGEKKVRLKGERMELNTTAGTATLILENDRIISLCSGMDCEGRVKTFFRLRSLD